LSSAAGAELDLKGNSNDPDSPGEMAIKRQQYR